MINRRRLYEIAESSARNATNPVILSHRLLGAGLTTPPSARPEVSMQPSRQSKLDRGYHSNS